MKKIVLLILLLGFTTYAFSQNANYPINAKAEITKATEQLSALQLLSNANLLNQKHVNLNQSSTKASVFHMDSMYNGWDGSTDLSVFHYDTLNRLEKEDIYFVDGSGNKFHYGVLDLYYNVNSKLEKKCACALNFSSFLFDDTAMYIDYTYDINNYLTEEIWYEKDDSTEQMIPNGKYEYTPDSGGNITQIICSNWDTTTTTWLLNRKFNYTYNTSSQLTEYTEQEWDTLSSTWEYLPFPRTSKHENIYDVQGNKTDNIEYRHNGTTWVKAYKEAFTHNGQNLLIEQNRQTWDTLSSTWLPSKRKTTFQYNINGSMTESQEFKWIDSTSTWDTNYRFIHTRNENYTAQDIILPYHSSFFGYYYESTIYVYPYHDRNVMNVLFNDMLLHDVTKRWMPNDTLWKIIDEFIYYYSDHEASIAKDEKKSIKVFPNPASNWISFDIKDNTCLLRFTLFDLSGRQIMNIKPTSNIIYLDNISTGMYLYRLETEDESYSGKISVIK